VIAFLIGIPMFSYGLYRRYLYVPKEHRHSRNNNIPDTKNLPPELQNVIMGDRRSINHVEEKISEPELDIASFNQTGDVKFKCKNCDSDLEYDDFKQDYNCSSCNESFSMGELIER
jgi:DNA-directed RNA polymerase subunit RPC12/RpoP